MAIIQYKCNTCNREIDITENKKGLEVVQKCIITDGCHGKLYRISRKEDFIRGNFPDKVAGLNDYVQRKVLFNKTQSIKLNEWRISHNLGSSPFIQVFVERPKANVEVTDTTDLNSLVELVEIEPQGVEIVSANELIIKFASPERGIAQLLANQSNKDVADEVVTLSSTITYAQLSNSGEVTIATRSTDPIISLDITFVDSNNNEITSTYNVDSTVSLASAWSNFDKIYIKGSKYVVRSFNLNNGSIPINTSNNGNFFYISFINGLQLNKNELLLLLSNEPYTTSDKVLDSVVDLYNIDNSNVINNTLYNNDIFINNSLVVGIYPLIGRI